MNNIDRRNVDFNVISYYLDKHRDDFHKQENDRRNDLKQEYLIQTEGNRL